MNRALRRVVSLAIAFVLSIAGLLALPPTAQAASGLSITKELDPTQGPNGFIAPNSFQTGALVRYRIALSCSSLETSCINTKITDVLPGNLAYVQIVPGALQNTKGQTVPITGAISGQTLTISVGSTAIPFEDGMQASVVVVARVLSYPTETGGKFVNQASAVADGTALVQSLPVEATVPPPVPRYRLTKTSSVASTVVGTTVSFPLTLEAWMYNNVNIAPGTTIVDTYPAGATVVDAGGGVVDTSNHTITWTLTQGATIQPNTCNYLFWCGTSFPNPTVKLAFPAGTFSTGQTVVNNAEADLNYADGSTGVLKASASVQLAAPVVKTTFSKTSTPTTKPGGTTGWGLSVQNTGNIPQQNVVVTDQLPVGPTGWTISNIAIQYGTGVGTMTFDAQVSGQWVTFLERRANGYLYTVPGGVSVSSSLALPSGSTALRVTASTVGVNQAFLFNLTATSPTDSLGAVYSNCATQVSDEATTPVQSCASVTIVPDYAEFQSFKYHTYYDPQATNMAPMDSVKWGAGFKVGGPTKVTKVTVVDVLPKEFEYVGMLCYGSYGDGSGAKASYDYTVGSASCSPSTSPKPQVVPQADGTTKLIWKDITPNSTSQAASVAVGGAINWLIFEARAKPGTATANYTNTAYVGTDQTGLETRCALPTQWYNGSQIVDTKDLDGDGNTTELLCTNVDAVQVRLAAGALVQKWDKGTLPSVTQDTGVVDPACPNWGGYTRYPCVAVTEPGKEFYYKFRLLNSGNKEMTNYVAYDILPLVGDTGVGQALSTASRGTEWSPVLKGPVTITSEPAAAKGRIEYNLTTNPCRPELNGGAQNTDAAWQTTCDNTWYTADQITDWTTVKSLRYLAYQPVDGVYPAWKPNEEIILDATMIAPKDAPTSVKDPFDPSIAWNSVAHRQFELNANGTVQRMLPAEPRKVGIIVPFPGVSVGDYVWLDTNRDGLQSPGEKPIKDVKVELLDASGNLVQTTTTNADGYYYFQYVDPGKKFTIRFTAPDGYTYTKQNAGGVSSNSPTADLTDSDADPATGTIAFTSPTTGDNLAEPGKADNPGLDAGFVTTLNLTLKKALTTTGTIVPGQTVAYTLTPANDGPMDALPGWSVTDLLPTGLQIVSMSGSNYTCDIATDATKPVCTSSVGLASGAAGDVITVTAKVAAGTRGAIRNVAYVSPAAGEVTETNPLVVPTLTTDTTTSSTDNDAEAVVTVTPVVSIGDYVWLDTNRDGLQTAGEKPVAGVKVALLDADGTEVATTTTDSDGYYWFQNLVAGAKYTVKFTAPDGYSWTTQNAGGDSSNSATADLTDSDVNPADGTISFTAPSEGSNLPGANKTDNPGLDGGLVSAINLVLAKSLDTKGPFYAEGTVSFTLTPSNEGPMDALAGWSVTDILPTGLTLTSMTGDGYTCTGLVCVAKEGLASGATGPAITVTATIDAAFVGTLHNVAYVTPAKGDIVETNPLVVPTTDTNTSETATDNDAQASLSVASKVSVGDYVWLDVNRDGQQTAGEPPVAGVTVELLDASGTVLQTTTTDTDGYYAFKDLTPGVDYQIRFVAPDGSVFTSQNTGDDTTDSDPNPATGVVAFTAPASGTNLTDPGKADNPTIDAGLVSTLNLVLAKSLDTKGPFYVGDTVSFTLTPKNEGPVDALAGWSVTEVLPDGLSLVTMKGDGYACSGVTCTSDSVLAAGATGGPITVTAKVTALGVQRNVAYVSPAEGERPETNPLVVPEKGTDTSVTPTDNDADAPLTVDSKVSVGNYVWWDTNRDGVQSEGEAPVPNVVVNLFAADGTTLLGTTTTNESGYYSFNDLIPGRGYVMEFVKPAYTAFTSQDSGSDDAVDSDADVSSGRVSFTAAAKGENLLDPLKVADPTIDAGLVKLNLTLAKARVTDGPFYAGSRVTFTLTPHNDGPVDALAGWSVTEVLPDSLVLTSMTGDGYTCSGVTCVADAPLAAGADGPVITVVATVAPSFVGDARNVAYVSPAEGETPETNPLVVPAKGTDTTTTPTDNDAHADLSAASKVSVGDYVWLDVNRDGQQDASEPPVKGATVELLDADGNVVGTTTTNDEGYYWFVDLIPNAKYQIRITPPAGSVFTSQNTGDDTTDSDADANGLISFTAPSSGTNTPGAKLTDNPTLDAGIISQLNLVLGKSLDTKGPFYVGDTVSFTLTPKNEGPVDALAGWSVTEVLPDGLALVGMTGEGYACADVTCTSSSGLAAGASGAPITVTAKVTALGVQRNVAYVSPAEGERPETNPLVVPEKGTDTSVTPTDNDADAPLTVDSKVSVGNYVWWDTNRDGVQSEGEAPVPNVVVNLYAADGTTLLGTTTTNEVGYYSFNDLIPGRGYVIEFVKPKDTSFTSQDSGSDDAVDSDADVSSGRVSFTAAAKGENLLDPLKVDDPTIDAGLVKYNLTLTKKLASSGTFHPGDTVTFTLTPHNDGPVDALPGWSVTDLLPDGMTLVGMAGEGYTCTGAQCVSSTPLAAGADGATITVTARISQVYIGELHNLAWVAPSDEDAPETNPLVVPAKGANSDTTPTDNEAQAKLTVVAPPALPRTDGAGWPLAWAGLLVLLAAAAVGVRNLRPVR